MYVSDLLLYKKVNFFFSECTLNFYKEVFEDKLYFVSDNLEVVIDLHKADKSYLEVEQKVIRYKQRSNMIAMTRLFDNGNLETVKMKTDIQFREEMKLTTCIIKACITLVQNSLYRNASENCRNDYLRDILSAMGIDVRDQIRTGLSTTKKSAGEADLVVYKEGVPNSFLEALNLSGMKSSYIKEHAAILMAALNMGFRSSDIIGMKISDIDWKNRSIRIFQQKTWAEHMYPMDIKTGNAIYGYLKDARRRDTGSDRLFLNLKAPYSPAGRSACRNAMERAGVSTGKVHMSRRTFGSATLNSGATLAETAEMLGHPDTKNVHKYTSLDTEKMRLCPLSLSEAGLSMEGRYGYE